jgi:transposase
MARRADIELWSLDECHFQQHGTRCRMWVPPEIKDPVVEHAPTRKTIACFGAVSLETGRLVSSWCEKFNADTFGKFLKQLLRHKRPGQRMVVILDNARYHHAKLLEPWLKRQRNSLRLLFLPPYSPQLAPIERVWKLARSIATHNRYFRSLSALVATVQTCLHRWRKPNRVLQRLCGII